MPSNLKKRVVDWTLFDQYPNHWGAALTVATVTACLRSGEYGYRETLCDFYTEALEGDPHTHAVLKKLFSGIANNEYELVSPKFDSESENEASQIVADEVTAVIERIPNYNASIYQLLWGYFSGLSASEIMWGFDTAWYIQALRCIPSRRVHYDDYFRPYVGDGSSTTTGELFSNYPGKFLVYEPVCTGDMPTREGLGRIIAYWMAFKRWGTRDFMSYCERFGKPTPIVTHKTGKGVDGKADEDDITLARSIVEGIGRGTQPGVSIPDTLTVAFADAASGSNKGGADSTVHNALIALCNAEISKAVLGNTLTTEVGSTGGNRALGDRQGEDQRDIQQTIAKQLDGVITNGLVKWIVRMNFGDDAVAKYCPVYHTKIEEPEDLESESRVLKTLVDVGLPIAVSDVYERFGWRMPTDDEETLKAREPEPIMPFGQDKTPGKEPNPDEDGEKEDNEK